MNSKKITIITVVYNNVTDIEQTILSVLNQVNTTIEYIIIDGCSTDGTLEVIKKYESKLAFWISEPDNGIYDAMNKGINLATGDYIIFMNAGDNFFNSDVLNELNKYFKKNYDLIYGDVLVKYAGFHKRINSKSLNNLYKGMVFSHQSLVTKTSLLKKTNFNNEYFMAADYDFILKCYNDGKSFINTNNIIASICLGGVSDNNVQTIHEYAKINRKYHKGLSSRLYFRLKTLRIKIASFAKKVLPQKIVIKIIKMK